ncbi:MAG: hypothetical protein II852_07780 [Bacteroidales bacterium]|nr:hypothetical protein [Bacteroidales bacterium]
MEKKPYTTPEIEVIDLPETPSILQASGQRSAPTNFDSNIYSQSNVMLPFTMELSPLVNSYLHL